MSRELFRRRRVPHGDQPQQRPWSVLFWVAALVFAVVAGFMLLVPEMPGATNGRLHLVVATPHRTAVTAKVNGEVVGLGRVGGNAGSVLDLPIGTRPLSNVEVELATRRGQHLLLTDFSVFFGGHPAVSVSGNNTWFLTSSGLEARHIRGPGLQAVAGGPKVVFSYAASPPVTAPTFVGQMQRFILAIGGPSLSQWLVALALIVIALALIAGIVAGAALLLVVVCAWAIEFGAVQLVPRLVNPSPPVAESVGQAAYTGTAYQGSQIGALVGALIAVGLGWVVGRFVRTHWRQGQHEVSGQRGDEPPMWLAGLLAGLTCLSLVPSLGPPYSGEIVQSWDTANLYSWARALADGRVPLRDYWFPYGSRGSGNLYPFGPVILFAARSWAAGLIIFSLRRLPGMTRGALCVGTVAIVGIAASDGGGDLWAELVGLAIVFVYVAAPPLSERAMGRWRVLLVVAVATALIWDPVIAVRGMLGAAAIGVLCLVSRARAGLPIRRLALLVGRDIGTVAAGVALAVLWWSLTGTLAGNIDFLLDLSAVGSSSANQQDLVGLDGAFNVVSALVLVPAVVLGIGALLWGVRRDRPARRMAMLILGTGTYLMANLMRILVRPEPANSLLLAALVLTLAVIVLAGGVPRMRAWIGAGLAVGAVVGASGLGGGFATTITNTASGPPRAIQSALFLTHQDVIAAADQQTYVPSRFRGWAEPQILSRLRRVSGESNPSFVTLGDAALLYYLTGQPIPWEMNMYDGSPLVQQERILAATARIHPSWLVYSRIHEIGGVPYPVRVPLLFREAVRGWVPKDVGPKTCSPATNPPDSTTNRPSCVLADILRPRRPDESSARRFWLGRIGNTVDLGYIPSFSKIIDDTPCSTGVDCAPIIVAHAPAAPGRGGRAQVIIKGTKGEFGVLLTTREGVLDYPIPLDHLWYRDLIGTVKSVEAGPAGWRADVEMRASGKRLY